MLKVIEVNKKSGIPNILYATFGHFQYHGLDFFIIHKKDKHLIKLSIKIKSNRMNEA